MKHFIWMQFLVLFVSLGQTAIITKNFKLSENQIIDIENGTIKSILKDSTENYLCNSIDHSDIDLVFRLLYLWDNFQCGCGGKTYGMLSNNPIYTIKTTVPSYFKDELDTADTATITPVNIDTTFFKTCPTRLIICPLFTNPCPGYENPGLKCDTLWKPPKKYWTLGTTTAGNKYLIRFDSLYMEYDSSLGFWKDYSIVTFILQTDGSLNFGEAFKSPITKSDLQPGQLKHSEYQTYKRLLTNDVACQYDNIFDIQGKRISGSKLHKSTNQISGVVIISGHTRSR